MSLDCMSTFKMCLRAQHVAHDLMLQLTSNASISTWADQFGEFFHAVQLEKTMMFFILLLIIAVAAFNLVSTLVMVVSEKESDIAILRTYGATPGMIMAIFIVQGGLIGIFGTLLGLAGGIALGMECHRYCQLDRACFSCSVFSSNVYFVNYLPSKIEFGDIAKISLASLLLSLIATFIPLGEHQKWILWSRCVMNNPVLACHGLAKTYTEWNGKNR